MDDRLFAIYFIARCEGLIKSTLQFLFDIELFFSVGFLLICQLNRKFKTRLKKLLKSDFVFSSGYASNVALE